MKNKFRYSKNIKCKDCRTLISNDAARCVQCNCKLRSVLLLKYWDKKGRKVYTKKCLICKKVMSQTSQYMKERKYCLQCSRKRKVVFDYLKFKKKFNKIPRVFLAWLTGFYEGEGNVGISDNYLRHLQITQKEKEPLLIIKRHLKIGHIRKETNKRKYYVHRFVISRRGIIIALLETMLPFMKSKLRIKKSKYLLKEYNA